MKKESFTNLQKCLDQKNLNTSSSEIPETRLAQLILENFAVNKETYKILLDIMYGDEGIRLSSIDQTAYGLRNSRQKRLRKTRTEQ